MRRITNVLSALIILAAAAESQVTTGVLLTFQNQRSDAQTVPAYVSFGGGGALSGTNLADNSALVKGKAYKLSDLTAGVRITQFQSGRIFLSLGSPLTTATSGNAYSPNFVDPSLPDFDTRWDKIEIDFVPSPAGGAGGANLSSQDFFGIPLEITTTGGGQAPSNLTWRAGTAEVFQQLGKLSNFAVSTPQNATGAIALGQNGVPVSGVSGGNVVRVISPATVAPLNAQGQTVYPSFASYVSYLKTGNKTTPGQPIQTIIAGHNGQIVANGPFQVYNLIATISNSTYSLGGATILPGDLVLTGTVNNGAGDVATTILVKADDLSDYAIYQANPAFTFLQGADTNAVGEKVIADFFSALNFGLAGSNTDNPAMTGTSIGDSPSWTWYGNNVDGIGQPRLPIGDAFAFAQPTSNDRYNQYAAYLTSVSDTYGFPYNDRLQSPLAALGDGSTLTLSILPDDSSATSEPLCGISIANAASFTQGAPIAPGSIAVVSGDLPISSRTFAPGSGVPLPSSLAGLSLQFAGGQKAPLFSASPAAAVIQIPWELAGQSQDSIVVAGNAGTTAPQSLELATYAPGIFTVNAQGTGQGQIFDANNRLLDQSNPAHSGDVVVIYCTGLGPVNSRPPTGTPASTSPLSTTITLPHVSIGGAEASVLYSGLTPGSIGLYQVNAQIPESSARGTAVKVVIQMAGTVSNSVTMAVH